MTLTIGVRREEPADERRVALVPDDVRRLTTTGLRVLIADGAGAAARFDNDAYAAAGATVVDDADLLGRADVVVVVGRVPAAALRPGQVLIGLLRPLTDPEYTADLAAGGVTALSLDGLPRTLARAQAMDVLTSQASVAGYKAVLLAANTYERYFPMLVTAAGTVRPAQVLVLGTGVAGLQAIGTARRLGAVVRAFDVRPAARADARSVGASIVELPDFDAAADGGYASAQSEERQEALRAELADHVAKSDVVITTAQVPGHRPPLLVSEDAVKAMRPGAVLIDLAASEHGGNVAGSAPGRTVVDDNGVTIIGADDLPARMPTAASIAFSRNITALLTYLIRDGALVLDSADEIVAGVLVTRDGAVPQGAVPQEEGMRT
jgi:NAD(P) transhydrogenase subunit alpha